MIVLTLINSDEVHVSGLPWRMAWNCIKDNRGKFRHKHGILILPLNYLPALARRLRREADLGKDRKLRFRFEAYPDSAPNWAQVFVENFGNDKFRFLENRPK